MERFKHAQTALQAVILGAMLGLAGPVTGQTVMPDTPAHQELPAPNHTIPEQMYPCNPGGYKPATEAGKPQTPPDHDCELVSEPPKDYTPRMAPADNSPTPATPNEKIGFNITLASLR